MKILKLAVCVVVLLLNAKDVFASFSEAAPNVFESSYMLGAGGVSDGEYFWSIPYETGSFEKISVATGKKANLSEYPNKKALDELSGYLSGVIHENEEGERFLYLAPYAVSKPLVRINLSSMKIDYPFREVGYYHGSCQITTENGKDYLWLFPSKTKPEGAKTETEIVKLNITDMKKEAEISTNINNKYYKFSGTVKAGDFIWLLPAEEGQPLVRIDTKAAIFSLDSEATKKIYSGRNFKFDKIGTGVFDGNCLWFVCENVSFMLNDSTLVRCDQGGNFLEKYTLSKDNYVKSLTGKDCIYLFAGANGKKAVATRFDIDKGAGMTFVLSEKNGYVPGEVFSLNDASSVICVLPSTEDGRKMPILRLVPPPFLKASPETDEKVYRDYGDLSKGIAVNLDFSAEDGYKPEKIYWIVEDRPFEGKDSYVTFNDSYNNSKISEQKCEDVKFLSNLTVLANKNGYYRFMIEMASKDNENKLFAFSSCIIDNIYERLPIKIARYDIESWDDALIENITHLKDFGAAFSINGREFIKVDAPMELIPAKEIYASETFWELESLSPCIISLGSEDITPSRYFADIELAYRAKMSEPLNENNLSLSLDVKTLQDNRPGIKYSTQEDNEYYSVARYCTNVDISNSNLDTRNLYSRGTIMISSEEDETYDGSNL